MGVWENAYKAYETARGYSDRLKGAIDTGKQAADTVKAGQAARNRVENGKALILNAEQAFYVMRVRYDAKYWVAKPSEMSRDDIENAQWLLVESWRAYRRLALITNAVQWAFSKMIGGRPPVPDFKDLLNAMQMLFEAVGENGTRSEVMAFWEKFNSDQLGLADQVARGLTNAGTTYRAGSINSRAMHDVLQDIDNNR